MMRVARACKAPLAIASAAAAAASSPPVQCDVAGEVAAAVAFGLGGFMLGQLVGPTSVTDAEGGDSVRHAESILDAHFRSREVAAAAQEMVRKMNTEQDVLSGGGGVKHVALVKWNPLARAEQIGAAQATLPANYMCARDAGLEHGNADLVIVAHFNSVRPLPAFPSLSLSL